MAKVVVVGVVVFIGAVLAVPALKDDGYSAVGDSISEGALGRYGSVQTAAFLVLGLTSLPLVARVRTTVHGRRGTICAVLLAGWSIGVLLCAVFEVDPGARGATTEAQLHFAAALTAFLAALGAMWLTTLAVRGRPDRVAVHRWSLALAILATGAFLVTGFAQQATAWGGAAQRTFVALLLTWMAALALTSQPGADHDALRHPGRGA